MRHSVGARWRLDTVSARIEATLGVGLYGTEETAICKISIEEESSGRVDEAGGKGAIVLVCR